MLPPPPSGYPILLDLSLFTDFNKKGLFYFEKNENNLKNYLTFKTNYFKIYTTKQKKFC